MQLTTPMTDALVRYLDLSTLELKQTAQNMANVDTPGYRTVGFDFAAEMRRSMQALGQPEGGTGVGLAEPRTGPVGGLLERPDGNDVSMDREGMKMAEAQLQFRTGEALLKNQFTQVMDAIHEDEK
jgi:flagellar basal-body rod protein FlgB